MTKKELKSLIKQVLNEAKLSPEEALYPANIAAKEIGAAMSANPIYKNVKQSYLTRSSEGPDGSVFAYMADGSGGHIFVSTTDAPDEIKVTVDKANYGDTATRKFNSVAETIKFLRTNPMRVFGASRTDVLKGATVLSVIDKGNQGKVITLVTKDGKKVTGKFSAE